MKADLHLHSRFSERPPEWLFRRAGLPDSYSEPRALAAQLRERGMDFVTITDHNRIEGCLEIADQPGAFLSVQLSARFPEDRRKVDLLVWGLNEAQHRELQALRENVFEVQQYLAQQELAHAVAHPLYRSDERFTCAHFEKLVLLFQHFEGLNGWRAAAISEVAQFALRALTPAKLEELANRHGFAATHSEPWRKILLAGSDDHGGILAASAFTETPPAASVAEFLAHLRAGRCEMRGSGGRPLAFSHSLYNHLRRFLGAKIEGADSASLVGKVFSRFMEGEDPTEFSWVEKLGFIGQGIASGKIFELAKPAHVSLWKHFATYFSQTDVKALLARETAGLVEPERRAFAIANFFANQLAFRFFTSFVQRVTSGNIIEAIQEVSVMLPVLATLSPYLYAFRNQAVPRAWLAEVSQALAGRTPPQLANTKRAWFTDTLEDVNGVANTIRKLTAATIAAGGDLTVVTSRSSIQITDIPIKNFPPIGEFELPEYELQKLSFPPILQIIEYIQREGFTELIISTPGPIGITALLAAKLLGLRTSGIYHTDFPQYVRILSDDAFWETLTWNYMKWFYGQLDLLYVNSEGYRTAWSDRGIDAARIQILPRGLDTALFLPSRRDADFWPKRGLPPGRAVLLYVGRISKEKDLDVLVAAWPKLRETGACSFAFVGEGPYARELRTLLPDAVFTGVLSGLDLAVAFASADLFVFPSTTDTFGNVILEALASGVPCIVSDQGGPKDLVTPGVTGCITRALDADDFASQTAQLVADPAARARLGAAARSSVEGRDWAEAGRRFWAAGVD